MSNAKTFDPYTIIWNCKGQVRDHFYASANFPKDYLQLASEHRKRLIQNSLKVLFTPTYALSHTTMY
jgi:DNA-binding transcriptional regulator GbsR (MarR family)